MHLVSGSASARNWAKADAAAVPLVVCSGVEMRWVANSCRACWCRAWQQAAGSGRLSQSSESGTPEPTARQKFRLASAAVRAAPAIASDSPWPRLAAVPGRARRRRARLHAGRSDGAQGESIPPGRRAPPRPSRNDSEEPAIRVRPNLANVIPGPHIHQRETKPKGWSNYRRRDGILMIAHFQHLEPRGVGSWWRFGTVGASMPVSCE